MRTYFFLALLSTPALAASSHADEEAVALAMAKANYAPELAQKMRVDGTQTKYRPLKTKDGGEEGYAVEVVVTGEDNGAPSKRYYTVEANNEAGVLSKITLTKTEGNVGP